MKRKSVTKPKDETPEAPNDEGGILVKNKIARFLQARCFSAYGAKKQITNEFYTELEGFVYREMRKAIVRAKDDKQLKADHIK